MNTSLTLNLHKVNKPKSKAKSTLIVDLLKKYNIAGTQAVRMFNQSGGEYIVRKCFLLDYFKEKYLMKNDGFGVKDERRWLIASINNDYNEPEDFLNWYKRKKDYIIANGNADLKRLVSI